MNTITHFFYLHELMPVVARILGLNFLFGVPTTTVKKHSKSSNFRARIGALRLRRMPAEAPRDHFAFVRKFQRPILQSHCRFKLSCQ